MKVVIVNYIELKKLPPVSNLIRVFDRNGINTVVITQDQFDCHKQIESNRVSFVIIPSVGEGITLRSVVTYIKNRRRIREAVEKNMDQGDILWTTTDKTVRELGKVVLRYQHVMQLMELIEDTPAIPKQKFLWCNMKKYAQKAYRVVVPEYNRAHIQKAWWNLRVTPTVLPNKMAITTTEKPSDIVSDTLKIFENEKRKIILYQGIFSKDRDIESFAKAVEEMDDYCLYVMGNVTKDIEIICRKYINTKHIKYVEPPYHLLFTEKAYIGLLPYKAAKVSYLSILNAVYCAPNKIWDYAAFGVPMLGIDVPGLTVPFKEYGMGETCDETDVESIRSSIRKIDKNHAVMSKNSLDYFNSVDLDRIVCNIISQ